MLETNLKPIHPGEVLREEFLKPFSLTEKDLAAQLGIPAKNVEDVIAEKSGITADLALRSAKFFGTSAQFWLGLQSDHDIDIAREKLGDKLEKEIVPIAA
jgi:addiction module HigA family antidote